MGGEPPAPPFANGRYRGADRRIRNLPDPSEVGLDAPIYASALLLVALVVVEIIAVRLVPDAGVVLQSLARVDIAAGALLVAAGVEMLLRWRLDGRAFAWWVGAGLVVLGLPGLAGVAEPSVMIVLYLAASAIGAIFLVGAWRTTEVDTSLTVARSVVAMALAIIAVFVVGLLLRIAGSIVTGVCCFAVLAAFSALAFVYARSRKAEAWIVLTLFGWGLAQLPWLLVRDAAAELAAAAVIHLVVGVLAVVGAAASLQFNARIQRTVAFEAEKQRELAEDRHAETMHEVRSTVVALEGGIRTLGPESERALATALAAELHRLRGLIDPGQEAERQPFALRDALEPLLTVSLAGGWPVHWSIPDDLTALGRPADVAQITHALLTNARKYAPDSDIEVEAIAEDGYAALRVSDRGPGVPRDDRERIFERGERAEWQIADGRGLGLHIARRLARDLDGELWVEPRRGGGARFVLIVPLAAGTLPAHDERLVG